MVSIVRDKESTRLFSFAAFVKDAASVAELEQVYKSESVADTHIAQGSIADAIKWLKKYERSPQRLLVDVSGSSRPLDELDSLADACEPSVKVYVVGDRNDVGLYRNLLKRGVQEYLVKPLSSELVRRTIMQEDRLVSRSRHGKCVTVLGTRGGVGTTSVATHLARSLSLGGTRRRVVYLDLNVYDGTGAGMLGKPGGTALLDVLSNIDRLDQQYLDRTLSDVGDGLYVLSAEIEYAEEFTPAMGNLSTLLGILGAYFHYVVIDLPARIGATVNESLEISDICCLVTDNSVHSARVLTRLSRYVATRSKQPTVLSALNHPYPPSRNQVNDKDFINAVDVPIQVSIPHDQKATTLAENLGQELPNKGDFVKGIEKLANLVTGESTIEEKTSWLQRLTRR